nr:Chain D, Hdm2 peptide [Homo sapiens]
YSQPSTSSSI